MTDIPRHTSALELRAAGVSIGVGIVLMGLKFAAYLVTGSAAIFSACFFRKAAT